MVRATVGGRPFDFSDEQIERRMQSVQPEPIREHLVFVNGDAYPPKQVLATVTGWDRTSFTTMEAQRVLSRAGLICRRADAVNVREARAAEERPDDDAETADARTPDPRLSRLEAQLAVAQEAIASLAARVQKLELAAR
jgi:hypothetical protein